jgi:predicted membrane protein
VLDEGERYRGSSVPGKTTLNLFHSSSLSNETDLNGHTSVTVFGGTRIDLTAVPIPIGETRINVVSIFGNADIRIPDDVAVRVSGVTILGGVKVRGRELSNGGFGVNHYQSPDYSSATRRLHIDATSIFSGVRIKR